MPAYAETDESIAKKAQSGDAESFAILVQRYEQKLFRYARRFMSDADDVTDHVQETFIKAYQNLNSFDATRKFSPWIYRIAHNEFVNALRKKSGKTLLSLDVIDADVLFPHPESKEEADADAIQRETREAAKTLLGKMPIKYRELIVLAYFEELSYEDIADVLHIPVSTVGVRLHRARALLRDLYTHTYGKDGHTD